MTPPRTTFASFARTGARGREKAMTIIDANPYVQWMSDQTWISRQLGEVAQGLDFGHFLDPRALAGFWLQPSEPQLNPIEFHGKRRSPAGPHRRRPRASTRRNGSPV